MKQPLTRISFGELIDKITILEIKRDRIAAAADIDAELDLLISMAPDVGELRANLKKLNLEIWDAQDKIERTDDTEWLAILCKSMHENNKARAAIKRKIDDATASEIVEHKRYG